MLAPLARLPKLETLAVRESEFVVGGAFAALRVCRSLRRLDASRNPMLDDPAMVNIAKVKGLRELRVDGSAVSANGLRELLQLKNLEVLSVANCSQLRATDLAALAAAPKLRDLDASLLELGEHAGRALATLTSLRVLRLEDTALGDDDVAALGALSKLEELHLAGCFAITDAVEPHLAKMKGLKVLDLGGTKVTFSGVRRLSKALPSCDIRQ